MLNSKMMNVSRHDSYMQNRELSWLKFNERVLEESQDEQVPLLERLKFISIFTSNLDEFFMIRVGSLTDLALMNSESVDNKTGMTPQDQLYQIYQSVIPLYAQRDTAYFQVISQLRYYGIHHVTMEELSADELDYIADYYRDYIHPILSPQVINSRLPFPHLNNKSLYVACVLSNQETTFGLVPVPQTLPEFIVLPGGMTRFVLLEQVILFYIKNIFYMYDVLDASVISATRNADISIEDEAFEFDVDYRTQMKAALQKRSRLAAVRLEVQHAIAPEMLKFLLQQLHLTKEQVFICKSPLVMNYPYELAAKLPNLLKNQLSYPAFTPQYPLNLKKEESITRQCMHKDLMLFYPYHSMEPLLKLLKESAEDPNVLSIKMTIYRLSRHSTIVDYLCQAAQNHKEVTVLIELKARFDEQNNIRWAENLEEAGCHVIYGFEGFKVHAKICLITRRDRNKINYITQIGTGNYNEQTAKLYTDLNLITANEEIGLDAVHFFRNMSLSNLNGTYKHLLVAPLGLKENIISLIDEEIKKAKSGQPGSIMMKLNSLTEKGIIEKLSEASQAGVNIQLIIRGICCLLPGIPGKTENITVRSIVGRFLEHARVYCFGLGRGMKLYISSADMMTRNAVQRVEIACPIYDEPMKQAIWNSLNIMLADNVKARVLQADGNYVPPPVRRNEPRIDSQQIHIESVVHHQLPHEPSMFNSWLKDLVSRLSMLIRK